MAYQARTTAREVEDATMGHRFDRYWPYRVSRADPQQQRLSPCASSIGHNHVYSTRIIKARTAKFPDRTDRPSPVFSFPGVIFVSDPYLQYRRWLLSIPEESCPHRISRSNHLLARFGSRNRRPTFATNLLPD